MGGYCLAFVSKKHFQHRAQEAFACKVTKRVHILIKEASVDTPLDFLICVFVLDTLFVHLRHMPIVCFKLFC